LKPRVFSDAHAAGRAAARIVAAELRKDPAAVLGLATGHTMIPVYGELVRMHEEEGLSFSRATVFNLDEYAGLGKGHPDSCSRYMMERLVSQTDLPGPSFNIPDGTAPDLEAECASYERKIKQAGGIGLQLLGLGRNGHIGFNEPGSAPDSRTRVVELSPETRELNAADCRELREVPPKALTMGVATIMEARSILLLVTGWSKAGILRRVLESGPHPDIPATFLHQHPDVTLVADRQAMEEYCRAAGEGG